MDDITEIVKNILISEKDTGIKEMVDNEIAKVQSDLDKKMSELSKTYKKKLSNIEDIIKDKPLLLNMGTVEEPKEELVHKAFYTIVKVLSSAKRINKHIMLVGPAGSSKSTLVRQVAKSFKADFYPFSVGPQTTKSDLLGFISAKGEYITTPLRQAFENGGVLLLDEFDTANAGVVTILNGLLSNDICSFPDKQIEKNPNFICICACNTYGRGADINFIGRNRLDGATLDRFVTIEVDYDKDLEQKLTNNKDWVKLVQEIRVNAKKHDIKTIISPRASLQGADLLDAGFTINEVLEMCIFKGMGKDARTKLLDGIEIVKTPKPTDKPCILIEIDFDNKNTEVYLPPELKDDKCIIHSHIDWGSYYTILIEKDCHISYLSRNKLHVGFSWTDLRDSDDASIVAFLNELATCGVTTPYSGKYDLIIKATFNGAIHNYIFSKEAK